MTKIRVIVLAACMLTLMLTVMPAPVTAQQNNSEITSCQTIGSSGTYQVMNDIEGSGTCIDVQVEAGEEVVIEGNGYAIEGIDTGTSIEGSPGADVTVRNVEVSHWGVGISPNGSTMTIEDSLISTSVYGIEYENANVELVRTEVSGNEEWGVWMIAGSFEATDSRITDNLNGVGFIDGDNADITSTTISNNGGAGYYLGHYMQATLTDVTIENNGLGIEQRMHGSTLTVEDSTITGNDNEGILAEHSTHELYLTDTTVQDNGGQEIRSYGDDSGAVVEAMNVDLGGGVTLESYGSRLNVDTESSQYATDAVTLEGNGATFYFETGSQDAELLERTSGSWEQHSTYENTGGEFEAAVNPGTFAGDTYEMPTPTEEPVFTFEPSETDTPTDERTPTPTQTATATETQTGTPTEAGTSTSTETGTPTETTNATNIDQAGENTTVADSGRLRWVAIGLAIILLVGAAIAYGYKESTSSDSSSTRRR